MKRSRTQTHILSRQFRTGTQTAFINLKQHKKIKTQKKEELFTPLFLCSSNLRSDLVWVYPVEYGWFLCFFHFGAKMNLIHQLSDLEDVQFTFSTCLSVLRQFESCNFLFLCCHGVSSFCCFLEIFTDVLSKCFNLGKKKFRNVIFRQKTAALKDKRPLR